MSPLWGPPLPALPYQAWTETRTTLHLVCQLVGKVRAALHPKRNHWWHVSLYVSPRGLTTRPIPLGPGDALEMELDLRSLEIRLNRAFADSATVLLAGRSVAAIHRDLMRALETLGVGVSIVGRPFDLDVTTPFAEDEEHGSWETGPLDRYHRILIFSAGVMEAFAGRFLGKQTPVHLFWHSFDLALTRFNGRRAPEMPDADPVTREAYSHEVVSFGFWPGDLQTPEPAYYAYVHPEPKELISAPLEPEEARWENPRGRGNLALLSYDEVRRAPEPEAALMSFLESSYQAAVDHAPGWDRGSLATPWAP